MSKEYVIDLPDDAQYILINGASENHCYTRVEQVDDIEELNSDYINEHYGELQDTAYKKGLHDGESKCRYCNEYQRGLEDAWEAARKIVGDTNHGGIASETLLEIFGMRGYSYIMQENTAQQAIDKIKAYEDKQKDRIEVGDEVRTEEGHVFVVTGITDKGSIYGFDKDGMWLVRVKDRIRKTG